MAGWMLLTTSLGLQMRLAIAAPVRGRPCRLRSQRGRAEERASTGINGRPCGTVQLKKSESIARGPYQLALARQAAAGLIGTCMKKQATRSASSMQYKVSMVGQRSAQHTLSPLSLRPTALLSLKYLCHPPPLAAFTASRCRACSMTRRYRLPIQMEAIQSSPIFK